MPLLTTTLVIQTAATWALIGLIWTIQLVHYPLFAGIAPTDYVRWQRHHMARITWLVGPLMIIEAVTAGLTVWLVRRSGPDWLLPWAATGLLLLGLIWLSTALVQAPIHGRLRAGFDPRLHARLVRTNWARTILWTARGIVLAVMLSKLLITTTE